MPLLIIGSAHSFVLPRADAQGQDFFSSLLDKGKPWWGQLMAAIRLRNALTHPKDVPAVTEKSVTAAIQATIDALDALSKAIYGKPYPAANRRLASKLQS